MKNKKTFSELLDNLGKDVLALYVKPTKPKAQTAPAPIQKSEAMKELSQLASFTTRK